MVGYATALRSCGYPEKSSLRGTTRQIFVGLENLRILKQEPVEFSPHRLWAVDATAQSEGIPIHVAAYTLKQNDCFVDFVLWTPLSVEKETLSSEKTEQEFAELRANFQTLVQEVLGTL